MNLLTSYLDRKYNRVFKLQRHTAILDPTFHEFYFTMKGPPGNQHLVCSDVPTDVPFIFVNPLTIEVQDQSFKDTLVRLKLNPLLKVDESTKLLPVHEYNPILNGKTPQEVPLVCIGMQEYIRLMSNLPEVEEDEGDETFEFI